MGDFDIMVETNQRSAAFDIMSELGWQKRAFIPIFNSQPFNNGEHQEIDLHWHLLSECLDANADVDFWKGAIPARIGDVPTHILNPTDQLLHLCVHGLRWNSTPPIRWIADTMMILKAAAQEIDWERLIAQAKGRDLDLVMSKALEYLRERMSAPIPSQALQRLGEVPISRVKQVDYAVRMGPPRVYAIKWYWSGYLRLAKTSELGSFGLLEYFRRLWDLEHVWQVPFSVFSMVVRDLWWRVRFAWLSRRTD